MIFWRNKPSTDAESHRHLTALVCAMATPASSLGSAPWSKPNKRILTEFRRFVFKSGELYIKIIQILRHLWVSIDSSWLSFKPATHHQIHWKLTFTARHRCLLNGELATPKISWGIEWFTVYNYKCWCCEILKCSWYSQASLPLCWFIKHEVLGWKIQWAFKRDKTRLISNFCGCKYVWFADYPLVGGAFVNHTRM